MVFVTVFWMLHAYKNGTKDVLYYDIMKSQSSSQQNRRKRKEDSMELETEYRMELHIWLDHKAEFEKSRDRLQRGLGKYPGNCGIILFARDSGEYLELPECRFDSGKTELVGAIAHTFGKFNVDIIVRCSRRPAVTQEVMRNG